MITKTYRILPRSYF